MKDIGWSIWRWPLWKWGCGGGGCGKKHYFNRKSIKHKAKQGISAEVVWWLRKRACLAKLQGHLDDGRWKSDLVCVCFPVCFRELVYVQRMDGCSGLTAVTLSGVQRSFWQLASPCLSLPTWLYNTTWGSQLPWSCEGLQHPPVNWSIHLRVGKTSNDIVITIWPCLFDCFNSQQYCNSLNFRWHLNLS